MLTVKDFKAITVTPTSLITGETDKLQIEITAETPIINGDTIEIDFPVDLDPPNNLSCTGVTNIGSVSCTKNGNKVSAVLTLTSDIPTDSKINFVINSVANPISTKETGSFIIKGMD
jgi:hypothetical protein